MVPFSLMMLMLLFLLLFESRLLIRRRWSLLYRGHRLGRGLALRLFINLFLIRKTLLMARYILLWRVSWKVSLARHYRPTVTGPRRTIEVKDFLDLLQRILISDRRFIDRHYLRYF
jgi:hypothetical protein